MAKTSYGTAQGDNPSSLTPGQALVSPMADELKRASDDGEGALDTVIRDGTKTDATVTSQLRNIAKGNVPDHPAMRSPNKTGGGPYDFDELPKTVGSSAAQPVRQP